MARPGHEPAASARWTIDAGPVATAVLVPAGLILVVGRADPVLRDRERQWISIMAELADHGWQRAGLNSRDRGTGST